MSEFNQNKYVQEWKKENMLSVQAKFKKDYVLEFRTACAALNIKQSDVIRQAMDDVIEQAKSKYVVR